MCQSETLLNKGRPQLVLQEDCICQCTKHLAYPGISANSTVGSQSSWWFLLYSEYPSLEAYWYECKNVLLLGVRWHRKCVRLIFCTKYGTYYYDVSSTWWAYIMCDGIWTKYRYVGQGSFGGTWRIEQRPLRVTRNWTSLATGSWVFLIVSTGIVRTVFYCSAPC